jgi:hypothetical protein
MRYLLIAAQWGVVLFAALAAILWWLSARVRLPTRVTPVRFNSIDADLQGLADGLARQSTLSKWAAVCAGIAAALQAVATMLPP